MEGFNEFVQSFQSFYEGTKTFFSTATSGINFISDCFSKEGFFLQLLQTTTHDFLLPILLGLIILKVLGFKSDKYIALAFVIGLLVAIL